MNSQIASIYGIFNQSPITGTDFPVGAMSYVLDGQTTPGIVQDIKGEESALPTDTKQIQQIKESKTIRNVGRQGTNMSPTSGTTDSHGGSEASVEHSLSAKAVKDFTNATVYGMQAISSVSKGYINAKQYDMQANNKEFAAWQNERTAKLLAKSTRDITRAAEADANVYRLQGVKTKAAQRVGQAASGFEVGKGTYRVMLDTTDVRTNYNAAAIMAKSMMQNAEIKRQIGTQKATAIINKADARALRKRAEIEKMQGWINGIGSALQAGASAYAGYQELPESPKTTTFENKMGGTSTIVHGKYTEIDI